MTRRLTVDYLQPVPLGCTHRLTARIASREAGRCMWTGGVGVDGVTRFTASAVFITVDAAHFAAHGDISGFGELFAELTRYGGAGPDAGSR